MTPDVHTLYAVTEATWPPARAWRDGPWMLRDGAGGGKRVSAATAEGPVTADDIAIAEAGMRALGQPPLFMIREGDEALDAHLAERGYAIIDPVNLYVGPVAPLTQEPPARATAYAIWEPLEIQKDIWAEGGIGPARLAVMQRAEGPKTAILTRNGQHPAGVAYAALHGDIAMQGGIGHARRVLTVAGEDRGFRPFGALHDGKARRADAAFGPDVFLNLQRLPDGIGRGARRRLLRQGGHRADIKIDRVDDGIAPLGQMRIQRLVALADHEKRGLPQGAHPGLGYGDVIRRDRPFGGGRRNPLAAARPIAQHPGAVAPGAGGGPCGFGHGVKGVHIGGHSGKTLQSSAMAASTRAPSLPRTTTCAPKTPLR